MSPSSIYMLGSHVVGASGGVCATGGGSGGGTPAPTGFSGALTAGSSFTVTGSGFGSQGPTILLMEDFEGNTAGAKISLTAPYIGEWAAYNDGGGSKQYLASSTAHTGSVGFNVNDVGSITNGVGTQAAPNILNLSLGTQVEIFISLWAYTPGQQFCGEYGNDDVLGTAPSPGTFPVDSCWKFTWLQKTVNDISGTDFNLCIPTYTGGTFQVQGESQTLLSDFGESWWSFTTWNRMAFWGRGAPNATGSQSTGYFQTLSAQNGMNTWQFGTAATNPLFVAGNTFFSNLNVPGYTAVAEQTQLPIYDDIYVAVGAGSVARVEITDSATYVDSLHCTILLATSWADGSVTSTVPRAGLDFTGQAYAYVWNASGLVNTTGLAV